MAGEDGFKTIMVMGLGLMGGSLLKVIKRNGSQTRVLGYDQCPYTVEQAQIQKLTDMASATLEELPVETCDLVILATPLRSFEQLVISIKPRLKAGTVIMDLGSAKEEPGKMIRQVLQGTEAIYIGGHPMNGSDQSGIGAASDNLYENTVFFLTQEGPPHKDFERKFEKIQDWVATLGAKPVVIGADAHDAMMAKTSHMPHLMASLLVGQLSKTTLVKAANEEVLNASLEERSERLSLFTSAGFKDTTRIAGGSSTLWTDIFLANKTHMVAEIEGFIETMLAYKQALVEGDHQWLQAKLSNNAKLKSKL